MMQDALASFLTARRGINAPWNCSTMPADWCVSLGYPDFAARWRSTVEPSLCEAAAPSPHALANLWSQDIGIGLPRAHGLKRGDIGVVTLAGLAAGAIYTGTQWVIEGGRSLHFIAGSEVSVLTAWRP